MIVLLSPAKTLDLETPPRAGLAHSTPALWRESERMMTKLKNLSRRKLRLLMDISKDLAELNWQRHNSFETPFTPENAYRAALAFAGDVYFGLDARTLTDADFAFAQERLIILSGLFGVLRPLDLIQPYRLEMGTKVPSRRGKNLYDFWGASVTAQLDAMTATHTDRTIVNCASAEYANVVRANKLKGGMVTVAFKEIRPTGEAQMIGVVAKRTRGKFARWMVKARVERREDLKRFDVDDYGFDEELSDAQTYTFTRAHLEGRMIAEFAARRERDAPA